MIRNLIFTGVLILCAGFLISCDKETTDTVDSRSARSETRAYGDKTPIVAIYVETNDVNPLNAGDYYRPDGKPYADIVEFFASNIHKQTVNGAVEPTLYLNPELTRLLEPDPANPDSTGYHKYVKGLQDKGIKVLVTVLGDWQGIGVCSMNSDQRTQFAQILAYAVEKYGLDGIGFSDSYSNSPSDFRGSYGDIITKLHALMPSDKLITIFQWGNYGSSQIDAAAGALIDYVYSFYGYNTHIGTAGVTKPRYAPLSLNLGSIGNVSYFGDKAWDAADGGYGGIMHFNLRTRSQADPTPLFKSIADGAWADTDITCTNGNRPQDWKFIWGGYTLTYSEAIGN